MTEVEVERKLESQVPALGGCKGGWARLKVMGSNAMNLKEEVVVSG